MDNIASRLCIAEQDAKDLACNEVCTSRDVLHGDKELLVCKKQKMHYKTNDEIV